MVLPNGIDMARYRQARAEDSPIPKAPGERFILCVARLSPEKRQMALVEALPHLRDPAVKLVLVGGGPCQEDLRRRAEDLGVGHRVVLTGMQGWSRTIEAHPGRSVGVCRLCRQP